jgi:hypothetical protein
MISGFNITTLLWVLAAAAQAQTQTAELSLSGRAISSGDPAVFVLSLRSTSDIPAAAIQWNFEYSPAVITDIRVDDGAAAVSADKAVFCASNPSGQTCLAAGLNGNTIDDGAVAVVTATLAPDITSATITVTHTLAASAGGIEIAVTPANGGFATVTVSPPGQLKPPPKPKVLVP